MIEQSLIDEGIEVAEIQNLCDVHAAVFKEALSDKADAAVAPGHPLDIYRQENQAPETLINEEIKPLLAELKTAQAHFFAGKAMQLAEKLNLLWDVDKHYSRKDAAGNTQRKRLACRSGRQRPDRLLPD